MYNIGDTVFGYWKSTGSYHVGTVVNNDGGRYHVVFEDGDQVNDLSDGDLQPFNLQVGMKVFAKWSNASFYPGTIANITGRAFFINFEDGDKGWTSMSGILLKR